MQVAASGKTTGSVSSKVPTPCPSSFSFLFFFFLFLLIHVNATVFIVTFIYNVINNFQ